MAATIQGVQPGAANLTNVIISMQTVGCLQPFDGLLFCGYGDYQMNTGPILIRPYDPATQTWNASEHSFDSEAIEKFRVDQGHLFALAADKRGIGNCIFSRRSAGSTTWTKVVIDDDWGGEHAWDIAKYSATEWIGGNLRFVTRSTDSGATWSAIFPTSSGAPFGSYNAGGVSGMVLFNGIIHCQLYESTPSLGQATSMPYSWTWDGVAWAHGPSLTPTAALSGSEQSHRANRPVVFADAIVSRGHWSTDVFQFPSRLAVCDGESDATFPWSWHVWDHIVEGDYLDALAFDDPTDPEDLVVRRTADLVTWTDLGAAPRGARSIAVMGDDIYCGDIKSRLWRLDDPISGSRTVDVRIASPAPDSRNVAGAITFTAHTDGSVTGVDLYSLVRTTGVETLVGAMTETALGSGVWTRAVTLPNSTALKSYVARATDGTNTAAAVTEVYAQTTPTPTITLTAPTPGTAVDAGTAVTITATTSNDGLVASVKFYHGTDANLWGRSGGYALLATDTASPWTVTVSPLIAAGANRRTVHTIHALLTDTSGATIESERINLVVEPAAGNRVAQGEITAPAAFTPIASPSSQTVTANAVAVNGTLGDAELRLGNAFNGYGLEMTDTTPSGSPPTYSYSWSVPSGLAAGLRMLRVLVKGSNGSQKLMQQIIRITSDTYPGAPTSVSASAGDAQATVTFTAPGSNGGQAIQRYRATASTGQKAYGASSPIVVTGLANGVAVTFTVAAESSIGYGAESSASSSVTPTGDSIQGVIVQGFGSDLYIAQGYAAAEETGITGIIVQGFGSDLLMTQGYAAGEFAIVLQGFGSDRLMTQGY
jgi:hypothetical protein